MVPLALCRCVHLFHSYGPRNRLQELFRRSYQLSCWFSACLCWMASLTLSLMGAVCFPKALVVATTLFLIRGFGRWSVESLILKCLQVKSHCTSNSYVFQSPRIIISETLLINSIFESLLLCQKISGRSMPWYTVHVGRPAVAICHYAGPSAGHFLIVSKTHLMALGGIRVLILNFSALMVSPSSSFPLKWVTWRRKILSHIVLYHLFPLYW